jgi:hypothetical protein
MENEHRCVYGKAIQYAAMLYCKEFLKFLFFMEEKIVLLFVISV